MKFKLKSSKRNATDDELLSDLKRVAKEIGTTKLTIKKYSEIGKWHSTTFGNRFGNWKNALELAGLNSERKNKLLDKKEIIEDVKNVAKKLNKQSITTFEYDNYGKFSSSGIAKKFNGWLNVLKEADLNPTRKYKITKEEYFKNIEVIWTKLGRQPKYSEIQKPLSLYSAGAYERKFGKWSIALEEFIQFINKNREIEEPLIERKTKIIEKSKKEIFEHKTKRNINHRLRFKVLQRDNFKCKICGKSPATDQTIILHVDHIKAWSKGGETVIENLQSLCSVCNLGKSNLEL